MSALSIQPTFPIFTETDGLPLENGYIWIGAANLDPQGNPINLYWDAALTIAAPQPIRTLNGYPSRNGTPARLYVNSDYSIRVQNSKGSLVYSAPAATERYSQVVVDITLANLEFLQNGTGAVVRTALSKMQDIVSVFDFMTTAQISDVVSNTGSIDVTTCVFNALAESKNVYMPAGTWLISQINIVQDGQQLITEGMATVLKQKPNVQSQFSVTGSGPTTGNYDFPIINVKASNVSIGDMTFIGNIASDSGEFNHCIYVFDNTGALSEIRNITLGNYYATDIRGDVLYVGGVVSTPIYNVNVISLDGDNIYRSICSVTGGHGVRIQQIYGNRVGYRNIDFESNVGSQTTDDCWVGFIRGGCVQLASDDPTARVGSIQIDQLDLDNAYMPAPTPYASFTNPAGPDIGILCSRFEYFKIGSLKLNSYGATGIIISDLPGEDKGRVVIDYLEATDIAPTGTFQCVIESTGATLVEIGSGKITLEPSTALLKGLDSDYTIRNIEFLGGANASLATFCTDLYCENVVGDFGNGIIFGDVANGQVINSRLETTGNAMQQCADMSWYNCTLDCGNFDFSPAAGSNKAAFDRGTLNGTWYDSYNVVFGGTEWSNQIGVAQGTGSPEGVLTAGIGALYVNLTGGTSTTLYVKTSGTGNTGWTAK
jgi:hypothetical protein